MISERDNSFDVLKGILIMLVLIGHAYQYQYQCWHNNVFNFIYTFHMPLFIFVSGYFLYQSTRRDFVDFLKNKIKRLIVPCLFWSFLMLIFFVFSPQCRLFELKNATSIYKAIGHQVVDFYNVFTLDWFLICVFVLSVCYYPICRYQRSREACHSSSWSLTISILLLIIWAISFVFYNNVPWFLLKNCQITRQTAIFGLGIIYSRIYNKIPLWAYVSIAVILLSGIVLDRIYYGRWIIEYNNNIRTLDGICCGLTAFFVLKPISVWLNKFRIGSFFVYLGKNSLGIYVIHMVFTRILAWYPIFGHYPNDFQCILLAVAFLGVSILILEVIKRQVPKHELLGI